MRRQIGSALSFVTRPGRAPRMERRALAQLFGAVGAALASGCDPLLCDCSPPRIELGTFPYHPLVMHLDLATLAYQLHGQSLVWPFDPFYEERTHDVGVGREELMARVRAWVQAQALVQAGVTTLGAYRGPGALAGFPDNPTHDPILYNYSRIHPWSDTVMNASAEWTEYLTPPEITGRIAEVYVSYRVAGGSETDVIVEPVPLARDDRDPDASDVLVAFEGGTGDKGELGQPASQSLMGFALLRSTGPSSYDVHISFRGSRSGSAARAALGALSTHYSSGNPDWITDLGFRQLSGGEGASQVTTTGSVSRGFAQSMKSLLPTVFLALEKLAERRPGSPPTNISVTGHSLGGALAQHFVSSVLLGALYGPDGAGPAMPASLAAWPWRHIKLVTFGAPLAGDVQWAEALTEKKLQSDFFDTPVSPYDTEARYVTDPEIVERLRDPSRPAGFRVLISTDAITTEKLVGGAHVGKTVYVNGDLITGWFGLPSFDAHEPINIRTYMSDALADSRTPARAWRYRPLTDLVPDRDESQAGSREEIAKLAAGVLRYYADRDLWFDAAAFTADVELMFTIAP